MTGDNLVIAHRKAGRQVRNGVVYIDADGGPVNTEWRAHGEHAAVSVAPSDYPEVLDFRFCAGLLAKVEGTDADRIERIAQQVQQHAARVITVQWHPTAPHGDVIRMTDTEGVMTWPR